MLTSETLDQIESLSEKEFVLLNYHLMKLGYVTNPISSLEAMQNLFSAAGPYYGDTIELNYFVSRLDNTMYVSTKSWPGAAGCTGDEVTFGKFSECSSGRLWDFEIC